MNSKKVRIPVLLVCMAAVCGMGALGHAAEVTPQFDPANFTGDAIDNPYFPLKPGTTFLYEGQEDGIPARDETLVTHDFRLVDGVLCVVVRDRAYLNDPAILVEETFDWYAQDKFGNVWYFGEEATEFPSGSKEGSWEAGENGALPGILMEAHPRVGNQYSQELAIGVAQDMAQVLSVNKALAISLGSFDDLLLTKEWSPLEKGVTEHKYYAPGVGFIYGVMVKGGSENTELVKIVTGP